MISSIPRITGIYKITCIPNGKIYIGSSLNIKDRWYNHQKTLKTGTHRSSRLQNAWNKYGPDAFSIEVVEVVPSDRLVEREQYYLDLLHPYDRAIGFNTAQYADVPARGLKRSDEARQRMREARLRQPSMSDETRQRISEGLRQREPISEETRQKLRDAARRRSSETLEKISRAQRNRSIETRQKISESQKRRAPPSAETREKMSEAQRHRPAASEETRQKRVAALRNRIPRPISEETRRKLSESHRGHKHSDETKKKMSEAHRKRSSAGHVSDLQGGGFIDMNGTVKR